MGQAIGALLPSAAAVALSPIPIVAVILMLSTPRAKTNGPAFAVAWMIGLAAVSSVVVFVIGAVNNTSSTADTILWGKVVLGLLLLVLALRRWRGRPKPGAPVEMPAWMSTVDGFTPVKAFGLGIVLSAANPKNLALTLAAASAIAQAGVPDGQEFLAIAVFVVLASLTVAGSVVFFLVAPAAAARPLDSLKEFMTANNSVIMMVILLIFGVKLLGEGMGLIS